MFLKAGFNPAHRRTGIMAKIYRAGRAWCRPAELIEFGCGDLAWYGEGRGCTWGDQVASFRQFVRVKTFPNAPLLPQSPLR